MSDSEKWAWWALGVVILTIGAYGGFLAFIGHNPATASVFSLLALTALPASSRRHFRGVAFDERQREIANKSLLAGFRGLWLAFIGLILTVNFIKGWDATLTLPVWNLTESIWWAFIVVLGVEAITTIILYRGGTHA
jgi:hypothetical protein